MGRVSPELLGRLLDEHAAALEFYARGWCDCPEDVVQEAFLKLAQVEHLPENVVPWLYRVVRNAAISAARSAERRRRHESAVAVDRALFTAPEGAALDPTAAAAALEALPLDEREVIVSRLWGGLSFEQIGELTGSSSSTAHRRYVTGLARLRERLGVECPNDSKRTT